MMLQPEQQDGLDAVVDTAIAACDGDPRAAVRALIVANNFLTEHVDALSKELDYAWKWISPGFTRSTHVLAAVAQPRRRACVSVCPRRVLGGPGFMVAGVGLEQGKGDGRT